MKKINETLKEKDFKALPTYTQEKIKKAVSCIKSNGAAMKEGVRIFCDDKTITIEFCLNYPEDISIINIDLVNDYKSTIETTEIYGGLSRMLKKEINKLKVKATGNTEYICDYITAKAKRKNIIEVDRRIVSPIITTDKRALRKIKATVEETDLGTLLITLPKKVNKKLAENTLRPILHSMIFKNKETVYYTKPA